MAAYSSNEKSVLKRFESCQTAEGVLNLFNELFEKSPNANANENAEQIRQTSLEARNNAESFCPHMHFHCPCGLAFQCKRQLLGHWTNSHGVTSPNDLPALLLSQLSIGDALGEALSPGSPSSSAASVFTLDSDTNNNQYTHNCCNKPRPPCSTPNCSSCPQL